MKAKPTTAAPRPESPPVPAPVPSPSARRPAVSRRWVARAGLLVLTLALAGGAAWYLFGRDVPPPPPVPDGITDEAVRKAVEAGRSRLLETPGSGLAWGEYGTLLLSNLFDREAVECFLEAEKRDPSDPRWPYARGQVALKRDPVNALILLETAAEKAKSKPKYRQACALTFAEALLEKGEVARAETLFREYLTPPDRERAEFGLALVALTRNDADAATRHFLAAADHPACKKQAKAQLAQLARGRGDVAAAKQFEADAAALDPDPPWPDPYLDHVVTLQVGYRGMDRRVSRLERDGKFREAADLYLEMAKEKRTSKALTGAGVNFARLREYDAAVGHLREAVKLDPADTNAHYTLALVLFTKWEKVAIHAPDTPGLDDGFREVVTHARATAELRPDHARALLFWGLALKYLGQPRDAIDPLRRGLTVAPEMFDLNLALGQVLAAAGEKAAARASLATAKQLKPQDPRPDEELDRLGRN